MIGHFRQENLCFALETVEIVAQISIKSKDYKTCDFLFIYSQDELQQSSPSISFICMDD